MLRFACLGVLAAMMIAHPAPAHAIASPGGINWTAPPLTFVTSLYNSVLGRAPESSAVVAGWAGNISSDPGSRRWVFFQFLASPEYKSKYGSYRGRWNVYWGSRGNQRRHVGAKRAPSCCPYHTEGPYSQGVVRALTDYYRLLID